MGEEKPNKKATSLLYEIFNAAADGMCLIDKDFTIFAINSTLAKIFSLDKEDTIGKKCYEVLTGSACKTERCCLVRILDGEKRIEFETEKEFALIKDHPAVGYDILKKIEFPWPVAKIVMQHHERMNGSGYPQGLQ